MASFAQRKATMKDARKTKAQLIDDQAVVVLAVREPG